MDPQLREAAIHHVDDALDTLTDGSDLDEARRDSSFPDHLLGGAVKTLRALRDQLADGHDASVPHPRVRVDLGVPASDQADHWQNGTLQHSRTGDVAFTIQTHIDIDASDPGDARTVEEAAVDQLRDILETFTAAHPRVRFRVIVGAAD